MHKKAGKMRNHFPGFLVAENAVSPMRMNGAEGGGLASLRSTTGLQVLRTGGIR